MAKQLDLLQGTPDMLILKALSLGSMHPAVDRFQRTR